MKAINSFFKTISGRVSLSLKVIFSVLLIFEIIKNRFLSVARKYSGFTKPRNIRNLPKCLAKLTLPNSQRLNKIACR